MFDIKGMSKIPAAAKPLDKTEGTVWKVLVCLQKSVLDSSLDHWYFSVHSVQLHS
jgi:hypothetical protein